MAEEKSKLAQHWPVVALIGLFAVIFLVSMMLFQVQTTEYAVVKRFGKPITERATDPGLHLKWPWPIEDVWRHDNRIQIFEGSTGVLEEVFTKDGKNIMVTVYIGWRIDADNRIKFMERVTTREEAESILTGLIRNYKHSVLGQYEFADLINIDPEKVKIREVEQEMLEPIQSNAQELYGIDVRFLGLKHIGLPEKVTSKVFDRMRAERERIAQDIIAEGEAEAERIKAEADKVREQIIAEAEQKAKRIRAEGDAEAATHYAAFQENPELAMFLRQLESLRKTLKDRSTLVLDNETPPFNLFQKDAFEKIRLESDRD